jgi:uncharacterized protein YggE
MPGPPRIGILDSQANECTLLVSVQLTVQGRPAVPAAARRKGYAVETTARIVRLFAVSLLIALAIAAPRALAAAPAEGITVAGYGEATAPAEAAQVQLLLASADAFSGGPVARIRPGESPSDEAREAAQPVIEALVAAGQSADGITVVVSPLAPNPFGGYGPAGPGTARLDFTVDQPTAEGMAELLETASVAAQDGGLFVSSAAVRYDVASCDALQEQARRAALSDAGDRARIQADALGVSLGDVVASEDGLGSPQVDIYGTALPATNCQPSSAPTSFAGGLSVDFAFYDPAAPAEVEVEAWLTVTYAIAAA